MALMTELMMTALQSNLTVNQLLMVQIVNIALLIMKEID